MKTYKVLVIDDAFFIRNLIKKAIGRKPVKNDISFEIVGEAENGSDGLRLCEELKPDIITVDFNIPELNGLDFAKYLKQMNPKIPILMISSNDNPSFPSEVEAIGCHFLPKPFQESFLWIRLDALAEEIENFDDSLLPEIAEEESIDLMKEISMEVEAEMEEIPIQLEDNIQLPKSQAEVQKEAEENKKENSENPTPKKKRKRKKKKKNSNTLFGLEIDDTLVVKPKTTDESISQKIDTESNVKLIQEPVKIEKTESKVASEIISSSIPQVKPIEIAKEEVIKNIDEREEISTITLDLQKEEPEDEIIFEDEPITADIDGETIVIDEDEAPIIIDDGDDEIFIIDSDTEEEIIIEGNEDIQIEEVSHNYEEDIIIEEDEPESEPELEVPDDFDLDSLEDMYISSEDIQIEEKPKKIGLNIKKEIPVIQEELSEKDKIIKALKENANYSYQNEMSYVLHIMEKLAKQEKPKEMIFNDDEPILEEEKAVSRLMSRTQVQQSEDFIKEKEEEDAEFDALFAEFNPNIDLSEANREEEKMEVYHNESKQKLLKDAPSITQNVTIEPPKSERIRRMYQKDDVDENQLIVPMDDATPKESIFTKIFNLFSRKK